MINVDWTNPKMLIAGEGKVLTNGEVYTSVVYLGVDEDAENWSEINAEDVPKIEETAEMTETEETESEDITNE